MRHVSGAIAAFALVLAALPVAAQQQPPGMAVTTVPSGAAGQALPMLQSSAAEASHVFKTSAGNLYSLEALNTGAAGYLLLIDGSTVPANGALTACGTTNPAGCIKACYPIAIGSTTPSSFAIQFSPGPPIPFANGIVVAYSSTGCLTKTAGGANVFFEAQVY